jgi:hypothetical protein
LHSGDRIAAVSSTRGIFSKTAGIIPSLRSELTRFRAKIKWAAIYGFVAKGEEQADSDIDLLIVGSIGMTEFAPSSKKWMIEANSESGLPAPDRLPNTVCTEMELWSDDLLCGIARKARQEMGLVLDTNGLIRSKKEIACQRLVDLGGSPDRLHDAFGGVIRRAEKKVAQLMGNHTAKKDGQI